jgi:hypothetical protein
MAEKEPTQRTEKGLEIPVPTRKDSDDTLSKIVKPVVEHSDEPAPREAYVPVPGSGKLRKAFSRRKPTREMEEAAEQEIEYPEDETNEG